MGKPVKIVEINKDGTLKFNKDVLQEILCEKGVKHKRICVLSVAGVFRGGKSLLLDFFLRYLQRGGTDDWLMSDDEKLDGFSWKGGCERVTTGIWVWNELYTLPLNPEDKDDSELQAVRDHLKKKCFEKLNCFLMPHPGLKVEEENFSGQLRDIRQEFQDFLRKLVSMVLPLEGLVHKKNMGKDVTCQQLFSLIQNYVGVFETGELPLPRSLYQASAELNIRDAYEKSLKIFCDRMEDKFGGEKPYVEESELKKEYNEIKSETLKNFHQARKIKACSLTKKYEDKLNLSMEEEYEKYKKNNNNKKGWLRELFTDVLRKVFEVFRQTLSLVRLALNGILNTTLTVLSWLTHLFQGVQGAANVLGPSYSLFRWLVFFIVLIVLFCVWNYIIPILAVTFLITFLLLLYHFGLIF